jgi:hypothetical protein
MVIAMNRGTRIKDNPTTRYYQRIFAHEIAEARQNKREPEMPLEDEAVTDLATLVWHKMLHGQQVCRVVEHYDPAELRDRLNRLGIGRGWYEFVAKAIGTGRASVGQILWARCNYANCVITPTVRTLIRYIEGLEAKYITGRAS